MGAETASSLKAPAWTSAQATDLGSLSLSLSLSLSPLSLFSLSFSISHFLRLSVSLFLLSYHVSLIIIIIIISSLFITCLQISFSFIGEFSCLRLIRPEFITFQAVFLLFSAENGPKPAGLLKKQFLICDILESFGSQIQTSVLVKPRLIVKPFGACHPKKNRVLLRSTQ